MKKSTKRILASMAKQIDAIKARREQEQKGCE
jgi:hypothetical protein